MQENPVKQAASGGNPIEPEMNPGDEPPPESPGAGENICPKCTGSGVRDDGARCEHCGGTGKVSERAGGV
jgi:hypothetical protein